MAKMTTHHSSCTFLNENCFQLLPLLSRTLFSHCDICSSSHSKADACLSLLGRDPSVEDSFSNLLVSVVLKRLLAARKCDDHLLSVETQQPGYRSLQTFTGCAFVTGQFVSLYLATTTKTVQALDWINWFNYTSRPRLQLSWDQCCSWQSLLLVI